MSRMRFHTWIGLVALFTATFADAPAEAQQWAGQAVWSAPGSTGIIDDSSTSRVVFDSTGASFHPAAPVGSVATIRYPVTSLPGGPDYYVSSTIGYISIGVWRRLKLALAFEKNDDGAYSSATLKRVRLVDGEISTVAAISSIQHIPGAGIQLAERRIVCDGGCLNPSEYAYFAEVLLWRQFGTSNPRVVALQVFPY
jgi:hypothetical protein